MSTYSSSLHAGICLTVRSARRFDLAQPSADLTSVSSSMMKRRLMMRTLIVLLDRVMSSQRIGPIVHDLSRIGHVGGFVTVRLKCVVPVD